MGWADDRFMTSFLILHGFQNHRPAGHWQHWLADELTALGHHVSYPQLPNPDDPDLEVWLGELHRLLGELQGEERVVICHSLSVLLWLHATARGTGDVRADRVLLVAPPSPQVVGEYPEVATFAPPEVDAPRLHAAGHTRLVAADNDPYCPGGAAAHYGRPYGLDTDTVPGGAHLDLPAGYGPWPSVLDWCLEPSAPVNPRSAGQVLERLPRT